MGVLLLLLIATVVYALESKSSAKNIHCQQITAIYNGTFQIPDDRPFKFDAQFQITAEINLIDKSLYFKVDNFNRTFVDDYGFSLSPGAGTVFCNTSQFAPCSIPFNNHLSYFQVWFYPYEYSGYGPYLIRVKPVFNKRFTLLNAIGNCATTLQNNHPNSDPSLYKNCFCCGDRYNPDPSLGCPVSPWN